MINLLGKNPNGGFTAMGAEISEVDMRSGLWNLIVAAKLKKT